jgi:hypothetical protein
VGLCGPSPIDMDDTVHNHKTIIQEPTRELMDFIIILN